MALNKRTPCVGICSTTYGDLVCRGCKRFAHEIVQWNGYDQEQQGRVWLRLQRLRDEVVLQQLHVVDEIGFRQTVEQAKLTHLDGAELRYELLRYLVVGSHPLATAGMVSNPMQSDALAAMQAIDGEVFTRSIAHYERNFKVPV